MLKAGAKWRTIKSISDPEIGARLMAQGVLPGSKLKVIRYNFWRTVIYVQVDSHRMVLRRPEYASIQFEN